VVIAACGTPSQYEIANLQSQPASLLLHSSECSHVSGPPAERVCLGQAVRTFHCPVMKRTQDAMEVKDSPIFYTSSDYVEKAHSEQARMTRRYGI
jgi:hypothetical protein